MPFLPLGHPEPFAATLGVMFYPGTDQDDPLKARAFAAQWLAEPLRRFHEAGYRLPYGTLLRIASDGGFPLTDFEDRYWGGTATGELFVTYFMLAAHDHRMAYESPLASWNNAAKISQLIAARTHTKGSRTKQWEVRRRFLSVAHLWAAWLLRGERFVTDLTVGYDGYYDFQSFLTEAEILRDFGQNWRPPRAKSEPPLPPEVWRVPEDWKPPMRRPNWPETGKIRIRELPEDVLAQFRSAGRPRKNG